jgi:hypothetical protein
VRDFLDRGQEILEDGARTAHWEAARLQGRIDWRSACPLTTQSGHLNVHAQARPPAFVEHGAHARVRVSVLLASALAVLAIWEWDKPRRFPGIASA